MATMIGPVEGRPVCSVSEVVGGVAGIEEEWFFEGSATRYRLVDELAGYSPDGRWHARPAGEAPFRTRMLVVRPGDPATFNGTVVVEWNNVSAGEAFLAAHGGLDRLLRAGFAVAGVSAQRLGVEGAPDGRGLGRSLKQQDVERYGSLYHPGDEHSYDIFTQAGRLLGSDRPRQPDPLHGLAVRHVVALGISQSSARLGTYLNAVHPLVSLYDALLLVVYPNTPTALDPGDALETLPQTAGPNVYQLLEWYRYGLRRDLATPAIVLNSESEASECHPNTQPDSEFLRWWEVPGTSHMGVVSSGDVSPLTGLGTAVSFEPAMRGAIHALHRWVSGGDPPPHQPRLLKEGDPPRFVRDEHGNAVGGIRWPDVEAPLATHAAERIEGDGSNLLRGTSTPFPLEKLRQLYPDRKAWQAQYRVAVERLVDSCVVASGDAEAMIAASESMGLSW